MALRADAIQARLRRLDPERVLEGLARAPRDFSDFAAAIRRWMDTLPNL